MIEATYQYICNTIIQNLKRMREQKLLMTNTRRCTSSHLMFYSVIILSACLSVFFFCHNLSIYASSLSSKQVLVVTRSLFAVRSKSYERWQMSRAVDGVKPTRMESARNEEIKIKYTEYMEYKIVDKSLLHPRSCTCTKCMCRRL